LVIYFLVSNSRTLNASCTGALSWWRIHLSGLISSIFLRADSSNLPLLSITPNLRSESIKFHVTRLYSLIPMFNTAYYQSPQSIDTVHSTRMFFMFTILPTFCRASFVIILCGQRTRKPLSGASIGVPDNSLQLNRSQRYATSLLRI
jgi:hypothetical protein